MKKILAVRMEWVNTIININKLKDINHERAVPSCLNFSSAFGYPFTIIHSTAPFLALGIGIDDMFVICSYWRKVKSVSRSNDADFQRRLPHCADFQTRPKGPTLFWSLLDCQTLWRPHVQTPTHILSADIFSCHWMSAFLKGSFF